MTNQTEDSATEAIKTQIAQLQAELETLERANAIKQKYGAERRSVARSNGAAKPTKIGRANDPSYGELARDVRKAVQTLSGSISIHEVMNALKTLNLSPDAAQASVTGAVKKLARADGPLKVVRKGKGSTPTVYKKREE